MADLGPTSDAHALIEIFKTPNNGTKYPVVPPFVPAGIDRRTVDTWARSVAAEGVKNMLFRTTTLGKADLAANVLRNDTSFEVDAYFPQSPRGIFAVAMQKSNDLATWCRWSGSPTAMPKALAKIISSDPSPFMRATVLNLLGTAAIPIAWKPDIIVALAQANETITNNDWAAGDRQKIVSLMRAVTARFGQGSAEDQLNMVIPSTDVPVTVPVMPSQPPAPGAGSGAVDWKPLVALGGAGLAVLLVGGLALSARRRAARIGPQ
jgi:hypothetical protein